uniref:transposase n=1 Tax=Algoriphagus antarcticus TaxID=238540 RepID=UPI000A3865E1|nr:transposase [Algoriphagus antarcticus]
MERRCFQIHIRDHQRQKSKANYREWGLDHVHVFVGIKPAICISDLIRDIKNNSSDFINEQKFIPGHFNWQDGYGAFSYGHSQLDHVYQYIFNQEQHHQKTSFKVEYYDFLEKFDIEHEDKYLFDRLD